jgi:hypothetical protein
MNLKRLLTGASGAATLTLATLLLPGCGTPVERDMMREAATTGEKPVAMKGETKLFDGKVGVFATVSRGFERGATAGARGPGGPRDGGLDDLSGRGRRGKDDAGITEVYNIGGFGDSEEEQKAAMEEYIRVARARRAQGSPMPPVTLRVVVENLGTDALVIEVTDVNSELGNFAVRPDKLTIAPGEKGMLNPMVSQLGVTSDEILLKVAARVAGKKDTQTISIKNIILPSVRK